MVGVVVELELWLCDTGSYDEGDNDWKGDKKDVLLGICFVLDGGNTKMRVCRQKRPRRGSVLPRRRPR